MCGVAGILRFDDRAIEPHALRAMGDAVAMRGPDGRGELIVGPCGFAHTRLAVLDPAAGAQPMTRGELTVVFNGEIYNHRDLRRRLEALGHRFTSDHSDTEVLLHGYRQWGTVLPRHLLGMFAFAIWNSRDNTLFLARDRMGKKPLYVAADETRVVFGSTVRSVRQALGEAPTVSRDALAHYMTFGYFNEQSLLQGVREIPAAHALLLDARGVGEPQRYWQAPAISRTKTTVGVADLLRQMLSDAVRSRLEADVPLGCFLSGGLDSSLIAALAQQHLKAAGQRLKTFTVSMPAANYDEGAAAKAFAEKLGCEHHELRAEANVEDDLRLLVRSMGEPLGDSSLLPTFWISRAAREHVTVALSGDGGDELFAGYERYRALSIIRRYRWLLQFAPVAALPRHDPKSPAARFRRLVEAARLRDPTLQYLSIIRLFDPAHLRQLGVSDLAMDHMPGWPDSLDDVEAAKRWDVHHYLPFDLLRKVDRASMATGLEVRCPMLDTAVVDLAAHLPISVLMPGGRLKGLLKRIAAPLLPAELLTRRKMGFALPISDWFAGELRPMAERWLLEGKLASLGFRREGLEGMINEHLRRRADHGQRLFALVSLAMWCEEA